MATGPAPAGPSLDGDANSSMLSWEGDRMFHIYIHDYCNKRGYTKTARELVNEADIPADSQPPINARQGLLFEWWSVFWTLFTAKNSGTGSDEALIYTQYQVQQQALRAQNRNQPQPPINRLMNGMPPRQGVQMPPNAGGMPNGMPGGQGMSNGHMSFPMSNQPGHPPSGPGNTPGGPQQQLSMQNMMPGQRTMGGVPQPQQPGQGMVQMQGNQHMGPMNRPMLPPNGPPNMPNHVPGNQPQAHSPNYPQSLGRPSSRPNTPGQSVINPSPSMAHRLPPGATPSINEINSELMRMPNTILPKIKQDLSIPQDKELGAMTMEEKQRVFAIYRAKYRGQPGPGGPQQQSGPPGPSSTPLMASANVRNNSAAQQRAKRNSTSPGEEEGSSPKRPRPSPSGGEHPNPPGPPQNQPPMASMAPYNSQPGSGPPGPPNMQNGMIRPPMNMAYQNMTGFATPMSPGMVSIPNPAMMNNTVHMTPEMHNYRQSMQKLHHKGMGPPNNNAGSPLSNPPQTAGPPPFNAGSMNPATAIKPVGGMMPPPPSPGVNKAQQNGGDKPGEPGSRPESSPGQGPHPGPGPQNPGQSQQPPPSTPQTQQPQQPPQQQQPPNQPGPGQGQPTNPASGTQSAPPSTGPEATSGLMDLQQSGMGGLGDLTWDIGDFDQSLFRQDPGDLNFERDFGQWFNPGGDMTLDMK